MFHKYHNVSEIYCRIISTMLTICFMLCSPENDMNQMDDKKPVIDFAIVPGYENVRLHECK